MGTVDASARPPGATGQPGARSGDEGTETDRPHAGEREVDAAASEAERRGARLVIAALLLPLLVAVVTLVAVVGDAYHPASDYALTEMQVRDVGRHPVLVGLYSRDTWNHPGPAMFYLLVPVYRLVGGMSVGIHVGSVLINGAALVGMALIARRRGGMPLMLLTVLGSLLLVRTLGAEFVGDPWNCYVTVLPFGLMVFLAWSMACGELWALPLGAGVATYLAQSHIGFVLLALSLLAWGAGALALAAWRPGSDVVVERRALARAGLVSAAVLGVMWLPPLIDILVNAPSNLRQAVSWFRHGSDQSRTLAEGWRVITGQFGGAPEWLVDKKPAEVGGESPFINVAPLPWALPLLAAGGVYLWRKGGAGRRLAALVGVTLLVSFAAVVRTVGAVFDYRLRWSWVVAMVTTVMAAWAGWRWLVGRRPGAERWLTGAAVAGIVVLSGVNTVTAAGQGTPYEPDSDVIAALMPDVRAAVDEALGPDGEGQVFVGDLFANGSWYARSVVLELEKDGYDARVPDVYRDLFGEHRVADGQGDVRLFVAMDQGVHTFEETPGLEKVAEWVGIDRDRMDEGEAAIRDFAAQVEAGDMTPEDYDFNRSWVDLGLHEDTDATAYTVAVFEDTSE